MARLPTNLDARKVAYLENCLARPPLALSFPTRSSSFGLPRIGVRRVYSFFPRTSSLFLQKSPKKCKKLQKAAKKCQKRTIFGKIGTKTPFKTPEPRQNGFKTARNTEKSPENALLARARAHADGRRLRRGRRRSSLTEETKPDNEQYEALR